jgi:succinylarginine dihydrolase
MWVANAATVSPSADTADGRVHFTPANLASHFHRALETPTTCRILRTVFADRDRFVVHDALPADAQFADEGAANHMRLTDAEGNVGVEVFVYGRDAFSTAIDAPRRFAARQTRQAGEAIARRHGLRSASTLSLQQSPAAIDAGVFHNDVIAVANGPVLLCHERAFVNQEVAFASLRERIGASFTPIVVTEAEVSLERAVETYVFNSQLMRRSDARLLLAAPMECATDPRISALLHRLQRETPIAEVRTFDLRQSMRNGGGPACLRLCVAMTAEERAAVRGNVWLDGALHDALSAWVRRHYRDRLAPADLADPALLTESRRALDELSALLGLGSVYPFQRT